MKVHNLDTIDSHKSFTNLDHPEYIIFGNIWRIFGYIEHFFILWKQRRARLLVLIGFTCIVVGFKRYKSLILNIGVVYSIKIKCNSVKSKRYTDDMELDDAVHTAILMLKEG
nr:isoform 2 of proteasome subunit alpha type-2-a [Quercus suber]